MDGRPLLTGILRLLPAVVAAGALASPVVGQDNTERFENLQVLPQDISRDELNEFMLENLLGLGLPRLQGEGCLFCHVGSMEQPRAQWDYASDDRPMKRKARVMMAMVQAINGEHLSRLTSRIDTSLSVSCYTCHAGRTDPRPLPGVILSAYEAGGIDSAEARYRTLRARYFGRDSYDFRVGVLGGIAVELADRGALDDAIALAAVERDVYPDSATAARAWMRLRLERTIDADGMDAAFAELDAMEAHLGSEVMTPGLLDGLAWRLFRRERQAEAVAIVRRNLARFPDEYIPNESMAFILRATGDQAGAERILERWLERHPDHERARRLLINMRGS